MKIYAFLGLAIVAISMVSSCTKVSSANDHAVKKHVQEHLHQKVRWVQDTAEDREVAHHVEKLLIEPLTVDAAIQVALLNNAGIQATFEELGVAQAELVQAGLLQNPLFNSYVRFPSQSIGKINAQLSVAMNFLDLFLVPLRKKVARTHFEQAKLQVSQTIFNLSFTVEEMFFQIKNASAALKWDARLVEAAEVSRELACKQFQMGNVNDLSLQQEMERLLEAKLAFGKAQGQLKSLREQMTRLLGMSTDAWCLEETTPSASPLEVSQEQLIHTALQTRFELRIAHLEVKKIARAGEAKRWWTYLPGELGISSERDAEGIVVTGPTLSGEIPVFDYGQAERARLLALLKQSQHRVKELEVRVTSEVREAYAKLCSAQQIVECYEKEIRPLQKEIFSSMQRYYNVMATGTYALLQSKISALKTSRDYYMALYDFWLARVQLERAIGRRLDH